MTSRLFSLMFRSAECNSNKDLNKNGSSQKGGGAIYSKPKSGVGGGRKTRLVMVLVNSAENLSQNVKSHVSK